MDERRKHREATWRQRLRALVTEARVNTLRPNKRERNNLLPKALTALLASGTNAQMVQLVRTSRDARLIMYGFAIALRPVQTRRQQQHRRPNDENADAIDDANTATTIASLLAAEYPHICTDVVIPEPRGAHDQMIIPSSSAAAAVVDARPSPVAAAIEDDAAPERVTPVPSDAPPPDSPPSRLRRIERRRPTVAVAAGTPPPPSSPPPVSRSPSPAPEPVRLSQFEAALAGPDLDDDDEDGNDDDDDALNARQRPHRPHASNAPTPIHRGTVNERDASAHAARTASAPSASAAAADMRVTKRSRR